MAKKLIAIVALMVCASLARAQSDIRYAYTFSWTGFHLLPADVFSPTWNEYGRFVAKDSNGDGVIGRDEVDTFSIGLTTMLQCSPPERCYLDSFSYQIGGRLSFQARYEFDSESRDFKYRSSYDTERDTGFLISETWEDGEYSRFAALFTPQTVFTIEATPIGQVPEPQTYAMLGAGLLLLPALARRRHERPGMPA